MQQKIHRPLPKKTAPLLQVSPSSLCSSSSLLSGMERVLASHAALWVRATATHPFIVGTGDGSIPEAAFNRWLMQVS